MLCPHCGGTLIAVELRLGVDDVVMQSCASCRRVTWTNEGTSAPVDRVLDLISASRSTYMRPGRVAAPR